MILSKRYLLSYFTLCTYSFCHNVSAITPCDLSAIPFKLRSRDKFGVEKIVAANRPLLQETVSTVVNLSLTINDLNVLDIKTLDIEIDLEMTQKWYDHRLAPDYRTRKLAVQGAIWQPKITFVVGSKCSGDISPGNDITQFWRGTSDGSVLYSERYLVKPKCTRDLTKYPFDSQKCFIKIGSFTFTADEVSLDWSSTDQPIELRVEKELGEFRLDKFQTYNEIEIRSAGNFSVLVLEIQISRHSRREVIQSFAPSVLLVKISYGVLWTKFSAIRTRIFTCQFSIAGILFLFINSNYGVSNVTYLKALDIWFFICLFFALLPLVESIVIHYLNHDSAIADENLENEIPFETEYEIKSAVNKYAIWIDKILCLLHPVGLLFCTTLFFTVFNNNSDNDNDKTD